MELSSKYKCQRKTFELNAVAAGVEVVPGVGPNGNGHRSLAAAVTEYLEETRLSKKPKTHAAYSAALAYFTECCPSFIWNISSAAIC